MAAIMIAFFFACAADDGAPRSTQMYYDEGEFRTWETIQHRAEHACSVHCAGPSRVSSYSRTSDAICFCM